MANTYIEPTSSTTLNTARIQINESLRSLLTTFKSTGLPGSQITIDNIPSGEQDGMLYRSARTNALYISDSVHKKTTPIGGNFTRWGIGHRVEPNLATLTTNIGLYEIGELVATLDDAKLYFRNSNTATIGSFKDVGTTIGYTVTDGAATFSGQNTSVIRLFATSNVGIGTVTPVQTLDVRGSASISSNVFLGSLLFHDNDVTTFSGYPVGTTATYVINTSGSERIRVDATGNLGIGTATAKSKLDVVGNAFISTSISTPLVIASNVYIPNATDRNSLNLTGNQINTIGFNGVSNVAINFVGYNSGTTQFRDFLVYNGKSSAIATFTGSTGGLTVSGDISASSDARLKTDIKTIDNALSKVTQLRGVSFIKDNKKSIGVLAQEVEQIIPEVVITNGYKSVAYGNLVGLLIEAIKELKQEIDNLKGVK
jgi:hypothetical protein